MRLNLEGKTILILSMCLGYSILVHGRDGFYVRWHAQNLDRSEGSRSDRCVYMEKEEAGVNSQN